MPMTYSQYREAWGNAENITPEIPLNIDIELSSVCNLKCPFCYHSNPNWKIKKQFMPVELAKKIIDEVASLGIPAIKFNWRGEPTLHPEFNQIMSYYYTHVHGEAKEVFINTNLNCKFEDVVYGLVVFNKIIVSLDSFDKKTYSLSRPNGNLETVISNIKKLIKEKCGRYTDRINIEVRRVITDINRLEDFRSKAKEHFGNDVVVVEKPVFDRSNTVSLSAKRKYCAQPSQRLVISAAGNIFACCVDYNEEYCLGNIKDISIIDAWYSKKMNDLRDCLKSNVIPSHCINCSSFCAYDLGEKNEASNTNMFPS